MTHISTRFAQVCRRAAIAMFGYRGPIDLHVAVIVVADDDAVLLVSRDGVSWQLPSAQLGFRGAKWRAERMLHTELGIDVSGLLLHQVGVRLTGEARPDSETTYLAVRPRTRHQGIPTGIVAEWYTLDQLPGPLDGDDEQLVRRGHDLARRL